MTKPPAEILRKLDDWCRTLGTNSADDGEAFSSPRASCTYLIYDAWSRTLSFANAAPRDRAPLLISDGDAADMEVENFGVLLRHPARRQKAMPGGASLPGGDAPAQAGLDSGAVHRRADRPQGAAGADGSGHYTEA